MGTEDNGPTLEGLAQRLEALERENASLREQLSVLRGSEAPRDGERESGFEGQVSRKALLSKAAAAAVAATAGTLLSPREARAETFNWVDSNSSVTAATYVLAGTYVGWRTRGRTD